MWAALAARGRSRSALRAALFRQLFVANSRKIPDIPAILRLDLTKNCSLSQAADFYHGLLAIASVRVEPDGDLAKALHAARQRIDSWSTVDGESLEWRVVHLLYEATLGDPTRASTRLGELLALQHDDGGWPWLVGEGESDAFATGQVLYALVRLNRPASTVAVERGRRFLVENQGVDGTWAVRSTLAREEGVIPTGRYWGTGWAVIGLLETLPTG